MSVSFINPFRVLRVFCSRLLSGPIGIRRAAAALCAVWIATGAAFAVTGIENLQHRPAVPSAFEKIEIIFSLTRIYSNPCDPDEVDVAVEFAEPDGTVLSVPGFWYEGFDRVPSGGGEAYIPTGEDMWMARVVARGPGTHLYRVLVDDRRGYATSDWQQVTCAAGSRPGFVRIDPRNPRFLAFDSGAPYRPVGCNLCWAWTGGGFAVQEWQESLAAAGGNWTRYWMSQHSAGQAIEWEDGGWWHGLGRYSQQISKRFDDLVEHAADHGVYVQMCLDSYNGWNTQWYPNWDDNPYNAANGGMLTRPVDFLTDESARDYAKKRFRYVVARWGYSPSVLCWEFWNEVDIMGAGGPADGTYPANRTAGAEWHREMGAYVRSVDAYEHLRTTSFSNDPDPLRYPEIWELDEMDIVEGHRYNNNLPWSQMTLVRQMLAYPKPTVLGEFGLGSAPESSVATMLQPFLPASLLSSPERALTPTGPSPLFIEPEGGPLHDMIWAAAVENSAAASWWWDSWIAPNDLWHIFTPLVAYLDGEDWAPLGLGAHNASIVSSHNLGYYGSQCDDHAYLWVGGADGPVQGLGMTVLEMASGTYRVEYWDTAAGAVATEEIIPTTGTGSRGRLDLRFPQFDSDVAVKIVPAPQGADVLILR